MIDGTFWQVPLDIVIGSLLDSQKHLNKYHGSFGMSEDA